jgi:diaminohydroxyphosphoribosylaminopyrimidine deaminase/5-amino-6-(5-phosphoribosylamino)uracil reductase
MTLHERFMKQALGLARKGAGRVSPNPMVGALVVRGGNVVGAGCHRCFGGPHAEVYALEQAGGLARGADIYVTLEPCSHTGKTPPCADALIQAGVGRVFVGMADPNPLVAGRGIKKLRAAGIAVETGILESECRRLNESFLKYITTGMPFVALKSAVTLDGRIATRTGDSKWITCPESRRLAHRLRFEADAVMVGSGTVLADDPQLTVRLAGLAAKQPLRVIVDGRLRTPLDSRVVQPEYAAGTLIATSAGKAATPKARRLLAAGVQVLACPEKGGRIDMRRLLKKLAARGIASVLLEGGAELAASALADGVVDKVYVFYAPKLLGGRQAVGMIGGSGPERIAQAVSIVDMRLRRIRDDILLEGYVEKKAPFVKSAGRNK